MIRKKLKGILMLTCERCKMPFGSEQITLNKIQRKDGLYEVFYLCPYCKNRYVVCIHSKETLRLQERINVLDRKRNTEEARKLRLKLKTELDKLNNKG